MKRITPIRHNLQALAIGLHLTNLQVVTLNGIANDIKEGKDDYLSYDGTLSRQEDRYLMAWLENEGLAPESGEEEEVA